MVSGVWRHRTKLGLVGKKGSDTAIAKISIISSRICESNSTFVLHNGDISCGLNCVRLRFGDEQGAIGDQKRKAKSGDNQQNVTLDKKQI